MSFQIGFLAVLKECLMPIIIMVVVWGGLAWRSISAKDKVDRSYEKAMRILAVILPLPWVLFFFLLAPSSSTGWTLQDNILHIEAYTASGDLNLAATKMALVENAQSWLPASQAGIHYSSVTVGKLQLQNGKSAGVLIYNGSPPVLILLSESNYFVLSHPGIISLYNELKRRGVEDFKP